MDRQGKLKLNTSVAFINQIVTLVCGFVLPRLILSKYGSSVNGLVTSISQFLGLITLCELGVGAVVQSALYKPLAYNDRNGISRIMISARKFFHKVGFILLAYVTVLMLTYPLTVKEEFKFFSTVFLIGAISISFFAQYFFGITNQLLLNSDQKAYLPLVFQIVSTVLNVIASVVLINLGASIQIVKLTTSLVFLIRPIALYIYVNRKYDINYSLKLKGEPIAQKWNGLAQHIASVVQGNTPTIVLTFFSTLVKVSIFNVYNLVVNGLKQIIVSLTTGVSALFGNMLAKNEEKEINATFNTVEWWIHTITTLVFTVAGVLIVPFVRVYTDGVVDANYIQPLFGVVLVLSGAVYCLRLPYSIIVLAAGHYKQTQASAIIEVIVTVVVALSLVFFADLFAVAFSLLAAMIYRTMYYVLYLKKHLLKRSLSLFIKQMLVDGVTVVLIVFATVFIPLQSLSYFSWIVLAIEVLAIAVGICLVVNFLLYKENTTAFLGKFIKGKRK
ncbi:MAG: sugar isomerase [Clostridia bacterium]|nr:sugar isomerase [Clostridia bacterium]